MYVPDAPNSDHQPRDLVINIRTKASQRALIDQAAKVLGKSRSEFMLEQSLQKAQDVLLDQCFWGLSACEFARFMEALDAPPSHNQRLSELLQTKAPWD